MSRKKFSIGVNHYWSKTVSGNYGGLGQQLAIEIFIAVLMGIITVYCYLTPGLGIFFAAFVIPTFIFVVGSLVTIFHMAAGAIESRKASPSDKGE